MPDLRSLRLGNQLINNEKFLMEKRAFGFPNTGAGKPVGKPNESPLRFVVSSSGFGEKPNDIVRSLRYLRV